MVYNSCIYSMKILITYSTLIGEAQRLAQGLYERLKTKFDTNDFILQEIDTVSPQLIRENELTIIIASTTGDGDLNPDAEEFVQKLTSESPDFHGTKFALFGIGESFYPHFCGAIDTLHEKIISLHGEIVGDIIKLDSYTEDVEVKLNQWSEEIIRS